MVSVKLLSDDPCSHGNENFEILTVNIGHNSGYIKDRVVIFGSMVRFSGSTN